MNTLKLDTIIILKGNKVDPKGEVINRYSSFFDQLKFELKSLSFKLKIE